MNVPIPDGYKQDARGALVPVSTIRPIDLARDTLVMEIASKAKSQSESLAAFKAGVFADIAAFVQLSGEQYGARLGGQKGNVTLVSFDGRYKIVRAVQETLVFDERLQAAKALIDDCIRDWSQGARPELQALVNDAFQVDKEGNINTGRVLGLRRLAIDDAKWRSAMQAISDALQVASSKSYVRVYERVGDSDQYRPIPLDVAAV